MATKKSVNNGNPLWLVFDQFKNRTVMHFSTKEEAYAMLDNMKNEYKKVGDLKTKVARYIVKEF